MIVFHGSRPFWRRRRRRAAGERGAWRPALAPPPEIGAWRRPPPAAAAARPGHARPTVASATIGAPAGAEIVLEQARQAAIASAPGRGGWQLLEQLRPACQTLSAVAGAVTARPRARLILVTSPSPGAGHSLAAVNLALGLSRLAARPVLLVDADGGTAGAAGILGWPPEPGLWDVLAGERALDGLIDQTGLDELWFLPPGRPPAATSEPSTTRRLPEVTRALLLWEPSALVVIDGPPLLSGGAAAALAACAGQVVLMVAAGSTSQQAIDDSLRRLGERDNVYAIVTRGTHAATGVIDPPHGGGG